jgi:hypothetical protein
MFGNKIKCPNCGKNTIVRKSLSGPNYGKEYYVCVDYRDKGGKCQWHSPRCSKCGGYGHWKESCYSRTKFERISRRVKRLFRFRIRNIILLAFIAFIICIGLSFAGVQPLSDIKDNIFSKIHYSSGTDYVDIQSVKVVNVNTVGVASWFSMDSIVNNLYDSISSSNYNGNYIVYVKFSAKSDAEYGVTYRIIVHPKSAGLPGDTLYVSFSNSEISLSSSKGTWFPCDDNSAEALISKYPGDTTTPLIA